MAATEFNPDLALAGAFTLVVVVGVFGNFLVIHSILKQKSLVKKNYYYLVCHLAVCDFITLLGEIAFIVERFSPNSVIIRSNLTCITFALLQSLFFLAGSNFMVLIAVFRYRAVVYPFKAAISRRKLRVFAGLLYLWSFIWNIPLMLVIKYSKPDGCRVVWPEDLSALGTIYGVFLSIVRYFIPVIIEFLLYYKICRALVKRNETIASLTSTSTVVTTHDAGTQRSIQKIKHGRNIRTFINCISVVVCFAVSAFPHRVYKSLRYADLIPEKITLHRWLDVVLLCGTCMANPFIYGILDRSLLSSFKRISDKIKTVFRLF